MKRDHRIATVGDGYYLGLDPFCTPDQRVILAVWVLLQFIDRVEPLAHYPATPIPASCSFSRRTPATRSWCSMKGSSTWQSCSTPQEDLKYIFVLPKIQMVHQLVLPGHPACFPQWSSRGRGASSPLFAEEVRGNGSLAFKRHFSSWRTSSVSCKPWSGQCFRLLLLEDENVAYCTASQLADACEQAVLLARVLPACTGRPHVFFDLGQQAESPSPVEIGVHLGGLVLPCGCPCCCPRKSGAPLPLCGCFSCQLCAGSSRGSPGADQPLRAGVPPRLCPGPPRPGSSGPRQHRDQHGSRLRGPLRHGGRQPRRLQPV